MPLEFVLVWFGCVLVVSLLLVWFVLLCFSDVSLGSICVDLSFFLVWGLAPGLTSKRCFKTVVFCEVACQADLRIFGEDSAWIDSAWLDTAGSCGRLMSEGKAW